MAAPHSGPTAKKDPEARLGHRNHEAKPTEKIDSSAIIPEIEIPAGLQPDSDWHPAARAFWDAYLASPLRATYELTDIATAWYTAELISNSVKHGTPAGQSQHIRQYLNDLGATESARRAMNIKIMKNTGVPDPNKVVTYEKVQERRERMEQERQIRSGDR